MIQNPDLTHEINLWPYYRHIAGLDEAAAVTSATVRCHPAEVQRAGELAARVEPVADGDVGELVITTLTKEAFPVIRFRTRDLTRIIPEPCGCGRTFRRMARVMGRTDDMLIIKGVNLYPSEIESALLGIEELEPHYQLVVDRTATLPRLEVHVEVAGAVLDGCGGFDPAHPRLAALRRQAGEQVRQAIGLAVELQIVEPGAIPRSEGKAVRVVERR